MTEPSWATLREKVQERAGGCCEYCQTSEYNSGQTMHVDHIVPGGGDVLENLCLSCWNCNSHKHTAIVAPDPDSGADVALFNPRTQVWEEHFEWIDGAIRLRGLTATGRATIARLRMNRPAVLVARQRWVDGGYHPPVAR